MLKKSICKQCLTNLWPIKNGFLEMMFEKLWDEDQVVVCLVQDENGFYSRDIVGESPAECPYLLEQTVSDK